MKERKGERQKKRERKRERERKSERKRQREKETENDREKTFLSFFETQILIVFFPRLFSTRANFVKIIIRAHAWHSLINEIRKTKNPLKLFRSYFKSN